MSRRQSRRTIKEIATDYGYVYGGRTARGHLRWLGPDGNVRVITGSELGNKRALRNAIAELRRNSPAIRKEQP